MWTSASEVVSPSPRFDYCDPGFGSGVGPLYTFGAIFLEYLLRLGGICISFWLISIVVLRRHLRLTVFWALNLLISLYEIWPYLNPDIQAGRWDRVALSAFEPLRAEQENYGAAEYGIGMIPSVRASSRSIS
jgi:hypothetical protein